MNCERCHQEPAAFRVISDILTENVCVKCAVVAKAIEIKQNREWALPIEGRIRVEVI
jgi:protein-arginine kinase activator protein McsA